MKLFKNTFSILLLMSFFSISWINVDDEAPEMTCEVHLGGDVQMPFWENYQIPGIVNRPSDEIEEIIWSSPELLSCTDCLDPFVTITEDVCITLTVNFTDDCTATDEICLFLDGCNDNVYENKIHNITPQTIADQATMELELERVQFVNIEIVEGDEIIFPIYEGWYGAGSGSLDLDFSQVSAGNHIVRVRAYPENMYITITKL